MKLPAEKFIIFWLALVLVFAQATYGFVVGLRPSLSVLRSSPCMMSDEEKPEAKGGPQYKFGSITESVVRGVTGNQDYKFGDGTKAVAGKAADLAKAAASGAADAAESAAGSVADAVEATDAAAKEAAEAAADVASDAAKSAAEVAAVAADVAVVTDAAAKAAANAAASAAAEAAVSTASASVQAGAAAKEALDERYDGYEFGDISKEAAGAAKSGIEQVMRKATGDEEYKFGDVTKNLAKGFLGKLSEATEAAKTKLEDEEDQKKK